MLKDLEELQQAHSWPEMCAAFGTYLGLKDAVPEPILRRALADDRFAFHLTMCRHQPQWLEVLFKDPRNQQYAVAPQAEPRSNGELLSKAAGALLKWGKVGFARIDAATYERRFGACQKCEYLASPPDQTIYKLVSSKTGDNQVCNACGCVASRKARLPTEHCPIADRENAQLNRWGEPMPA